MSEVEVCWLGRAQLVHFAPPMAASHLPPSFEEELLRALLRHATPQQRAAELLLQQARGSPLQSRLHPHLIEAATPCVRTATPVIQPATPAQDVAWTLMVHRRWLATRALPALVTLARPPLRLAFALNALLINALLLGELRLDGSASHG